MARINANGIDIEYVTAGTGHGGEAGLSYQHSLLHWSGRFRCALCPALTAAEQFNAGVRSVSVPIQRCGGFQRRGAKGRDGCRVYSPAVALGVSLHSRTCVLIWR